MNNHDIKSKIIKKQTENSGQQPPTVFVATVSCFNGTITISIKNGNTYTAPLTAGACPPDFNAPNCAGYSYDPDLDNSVYSNPSAYAQSTANDVGLMTFFGSDAGFQAYISVDQNVFSDSGVQWSCWTGNN